MSFAVALLAASTLALTPMGLSPTGSPAGGAHGEGADVSAVFADPTGDVLRAVTFDSDAVPPGARVTVTERTGRDGTRIRLRLEGVEPDRTFGAHVHTNPCGTRPEDSGGHYQQDRDPKQPSTDPAYANPRNEVWLDLTTDGRGDGSSSASVAWRFRPGEARSVVIHEHATERAPGRAGMAGARLACVNVPFA
ncbi:superoxide dismutase family protein [Streptomyces sp. VNUA116]|uniref:superoxide dismutase family protein n=1 Tax=Streptomyces sp. VNUA116 TaxID=3062449 RepID=UPI00267498DC|nr:superoxide dismutase family protein [Streptomyces sp. VNUA116]WKU44625.1 superoxide dismutase family protein [Streptomyces sp. VNUA116]